MRKYKAVVTISREDDTVHTRIKLKNGERLDANMLIALEFLNAVLNSAEETGVLVKPFKKSVKNMLKDFVNADTEERLDMLNAFVEDRNILGEEEKDETL